MATRRLVVQFHRNGGKLFKNSVVSSLQRSLGKGIQANSRASALPIYSSSSRVYSTEAQDPGSNDSSFKRINIAQTDQDFINAFGLVTNENDDAVSVVLGSQKREELWEGCHNEEESRLIKMATSNSDHHFLENKISPEEDFWIKLCSFAPDNTIFPFVFKYNDVAFLPYAFNIDYTVESKTNLDAAYQFYQQPMASYSYNSDMTVEPETFRHDDIRKQAGIFYSEPHFPNEYLDRHDEPNPPKSTGFA